MQIWIHDKSMRKVCALNNNVPDMLPYSSSQWHTYLEYSTSTFDFTIPKIVNGKLHDDIKYINDQMFVSFYFDNSYHVFYVSQLVENDFNFQVTCNNTNLELAREVARPLADSGGAKSVEWYLRNLELLGFAGLEIGVNEISDRTRTLTFESQSGTKLEQLHSLMNQFDAEFIFRTELNRDGTMKRFIIDIYQEADKNHHGIGKVRGDVILYYQSGLKGVQVTSDKTQLFNAGVFTGANGVNLDSVEFEEKNELGQVEFYSRKGTSFIFAPLSRERYPSTMNPDSADNWTRKDFQTEYKDVESLKAYALRTIKQYAYPLMTYTVSVQSSFIENYKDINLGDTVKIIDNNFRGGLALEARVSEMIISFDNPANNSVVFTNFKKLDNKPSDALQQRIDEIVSKSLPYHVEIRTTNGTVFKNGIGRSTVKPILKQGDKIVDATYRFVIDGTIKYVGMTYDMVASEINQPTTLTISAWVDNKEVASEEVTFVNVSDGKQGPKGDDGKTTYFHTAWSYSADGKDRFTTVYPNLNLFDGTSDKPSSSTGSDWNIKEIGVYNTPKVGQEYTFSVEVLEADHDVWLDVWRYNNVGSGIGRRIDRLASIRNIKSGEKVHVTFTWPDPGNSGATQIAVSLAWTEHTYTGSYSYRKAKLEIGNTPTPWMPSASEVKTADYPSYIGHYTDFTKADSTNPSDYTWSLIRGNDGKDGANGGENLIVNSAFPEDIDGWGFWDESTPNNNLHIATHGFYYNGTKPLFRLDNNTNGVVPASTKRFPVKRNTDYSLNIQIFATGNLKSVDIYFLGRKANETDKELTKVIHLKTHTGSPSTTQTVKWHLTFNSGDCDEGFIRINNNGTTDGKTSTLFFAELDCYEGTGDRAWQASSKDFEEEIDTKADDVLTQAQLNRLNETNSIIKAELDAKASLDTLNQWVEAYQNFVNANNANRAQAEKDLADASARVTKLENDLNDMSERWNFIDSYMAASNEGLVVGEKDKSSSIMFNPNGRISMFSAGNEVMYISKGVINIENGIFSKTIQIGRYREEQDLLNPDRNVIRYVGGA
ncbi:antireceptor [Streptococcus phage P7152]|uniref:Antireceptor n=1 Tax=Streptococcus phage P7152 TaxID=1971425 RepID=A0A286QP17_9CAUD|nr:antireceptor [Streptococcus phage P7152]ARU13680.1 antireceptor [Streptococcus phage P7152]